MPSFSLVVQWKRACGWRLQIESGVCFSITSAIIRFWEIRRRFFTKWINCARKKFEWYWGYSLIWTYLFLILFILWKCILWVVKNNHWLPNLRSGCSISKSSISLFVVFLYSCMYLPLKVCFRSSVRFFWTQCLTFGNVTLNFDGPYPTRKLLDQNWL